MRRPNVLLILNDDMGYSDLGCYGGEIDTPNLNRLAQNGLRYTQFYNTARCCPSRASLLTGLYPHQADVGDMVGNDGVDGYLGDLSADSLTLAELLGSQGYATMMSGKWHVTGAYDSPHNWPCQRGFDRYFGNLCGAASYYAPKSLYRDNTLEEAPAGDWYYTDAISDEAVAQLREHFDKKDGRPFFQYLAYTAPHWPLHAKEKDIAKYKGRFDRGWDRLREERLERLRKMGLLGDEAGLSGRDPSQPAWEDQPNKAWQARRMEVYAAQVDCMDQGIGRVIEALDEAGELENTLIFFLADNGGCHEEIGLNSNWAKGLKKSISAQEFTRDGRAVQFGNDPSIVPGPEDTYCSYGVPWANVSNTPFRKYKSWVHEGGIATPLIVHWPEGISARGELRRQTGQLPDIMGTLIDACGVEYPESFQGKKRLPHEGYSLLPTFSDKPSERPVLYWEHEGNAAVRRGKWKLVREYLFPGKIHGYQGEAGAGPWELYDLETDRSELKDLASEFPELVDELSSLWEAWAKRCQVEPWDRIRKIRQKNRA